MEAESRMLILEKVANPPSKDQMLLRSYFADTEKRKGQARLKADNALLQRQYVASRPKRSLDSNNRPRFSHHQPPSTAPGGAFGKLVSRPVIGGATPAGGRFRMRGPVGPARPAAKPVMKGDPVAQAMSAGAARNNVQASMPRPAPRPARPQVAPARPAQAPSSQAGAPRGPQARTVPRGAIGQNPDGSYIMSTAKPVATPQTSGTGNMAFKNYSGLAKALRAQGVSATGAGLRDRFGGRMIFGNNKTQFNVGQLAQKMKADKNWRFSQGSGVATGLGSAGSGTRWRSGLAARAKPAPKPAVPARQQAMRASAASAMRSAGVSAPMARRMAASPFADVAMNQPKRPAPRVQIARNRRTPGLP
jgi:hypothetical protein